MLSITRPTNRTPIHPSVRTTGRPKCEMSYFLASVGACNLFLTCMIIDIHIMVNWQVSKQNLLTCVTWPYRQLRCQIMEVACFLKFSPDQLLAIKWLRTQVLRSRSIVCSKFKMHKRELHFWLWLNIYIRNVVVVKENNRNVVMEED